MLKYDTHAITYRELPNEVALSLSVTNCPNRCPGCHSAHLREDIGIDLWEVTNLLTKYSEHITAICFLGHGGLQHTEEFAQLLHTLSVSHPNLKLGLYSGFDYIIDDFKPYLTYYKVGRYIEELGGLDKPETTNQVYYEIIDGELVDKTKLFRSKNP